MRVADRPSNFPHFTEPGEKVLWVPTVRGQSSSPGGEGGARSDGGEFKTPSPSIAGREYAATTLLRAANVRNICWSSGLHWERGV
ncbi:hypothetical protein LINPERPRIM_LOCUS6706 [Linum perenne]